MFRQPLFATRMARVFEVRGTRHYSQQPPPPNTNSPPQPPSQPQGKVVSPHIGFYRSFGRPIAKVFLMSIAVYQVAYWTWRKLESDEIKRDRTSEIEQLESELKGLTKKVQKSS